MEEREELIAKGIIGEFDYFMEEKKLWTDRYESAGIDFNPHPLKDNLIIEYDKAKGFRITFFNFSCTGEFEVKNEYTAPIHLR
ncbi:MAG: hypothetical protein ABIJ14_01850 [Nanoarchaeota archaeon]|nr:hypothetical protein [Nanoarchaeota archaeon]